MNKFLSVKVIFLIIFIIVWITTAYYDISADYDFAEDMKIIVGMCFGKIFALFWGILALGSGLYGWKCWGIHPWLRETKHGEALNSIISTIMGVLLILISLGFGVYDV